MEPAESSNVAVWLPEPGWIWGMAAIVLLALGFAWLLRRAGFPGSAAAGGVLAGLLLGPGVLGRLAPDAHGRMFGAAPTELAAWRQAERAVGATEFVAGSVGAEPESATDAIESLARIADERRVAWQAAIERERRPFAWFTVALAFLLIMGTALAREADAPAPREPRSRGIMLGAWAAVLPAALAAVTLGWLGEESWSPTMLASMACVAAGAWPPCREDRALVDRSMPGGIATARIAGLFANAVALALLSAAAYQAGSTVAMAGVSALASGLAVGGVFPSIAVSSVTRLLGPLLAPMVALLAALATIRVEPFLDIRWGILVALTLIADDGRWIGGTLGAWLPGGVRPSRAIGIGLLTVPAGPSMVALSAVGLQVGLLSPPVGLGLVAAVLVIELTGPIRRKLSADLDPDRPGRESGP